MELTESAVIGAWLKAHNVTGEVIHRVHEACFDYINIGVIRDDPDEDFMAGVHVRMGFQLALEARRQCKNALWVRQNDYLYYFIGDEDEVLEKLGNLLK